MSGTIRFITKKPDLDEFGGYLTGETSYTDHAAQNFNGNGAINLPIVNGLAAVRMVGWGISDSGYINQIRVGEGTANPEGFVPRVNNDNVQGGRASLRIQPTNDLTLDASFTRQSEHSDGSSRYTPAGVTAYSIPGTPTVHGCDLCNTDVTRSPSQDDLKVISLTLNYKSPYGTLTATTNQYDRRLDYNLDTTAILTLFGIPVPSEAYETNSRRLNSSEIRFASNFNFPINFVVGGYRQHESADHTVEDLSVNGEGLATGAFSTLNSQDALLNPGLGSTIFGRTDSRRTTQYAAFGEATWTVMSRLKLTAGVRYFTEQLDGVQQETHPIGGFAPGVTYEQPIVDEGQSYKKTTLKFNASYAFDDGLLAYTTAAQGFRAGGLNSQAGPFLVPAAYGPDSLWDYEIGAKGRLFDRRLQYQVDAYWIDWKDIQVQEVTQTYALNYTGNAGDAVSRGIEFEFTVWPVEHLTVNFSGSFQDAHLTQGATPAQLAINSTVGVTGNDLPDVARFQYDLGLNYTAPINQNWSGTLAADINYRGEANAYFGASPFNIKLAPYTLLNLRAQVSRGPWSAMVFVRNATDERAQVSAINSNQDPYALLTVRPRTVGVSVTRNF